MTAEPPALQDIRKLAKDLRAVSYVATAISLEMAADDLSALFSRLDSSPDSPPPTLTPEPGWVLERVDDDSADRATTVRDGDWIRLPSGRAFPLVARADWGDYELGQFNGLMECGSALYRERPQPETPQTFEGEFCLNEGEYSYHKRPSDMPQGRYRTTYTRIVGGEDR